MSRQIKNKAELRALVRAEQSKFAACEGACFGDVVWHAPDAGGCNWSLSTMEGGNSSACVEALRPFTDKLRETYNVPDEGR
ncbi:Lysozyme inhibitor LprI N-terminal domain-containing protein [Cupriavidus necator]|uniref:Uncharacterized protein n=2 Tax=Cupriavidus necator TaxID=106590 RepID=Q0K7U4_CUPNH|nr:MULTISPECIES: hypothetical protein [Cupriavidus]RWA47231.1 hypothetical protein AU476_34635 [Cupriavidus sp. UYMSc13B]EON17191.1 hypothetical protein C265_24655 [Cupriavidus sp. GA3-3]KUE90231.1 hypothetical protein ASL20_03575 [Cupriavidus necator]QCC01700.1 hypothetical protein E6A55_14540 [Cupriavidus necator H16]QQB75469.1 hypothetical protein I6H87_11595 [Cupriavidus necator]